MISEAQALQKVLSFVNSRDFVDFEEYGDEFVVSSICLSERSDYWIVMANSRAWVEQGEFSKCYVGVSAYLINVKSGELEIVGSAETPEAFLQNKYAKERQSDD